MVAPKNLRVVTQNFRAIDSADIIIDGITLVAGINGCGKSTLSKLIYNLYNTLAEYDSLISYHLYEKLSGVIHFLKIAQRELYSVKSYREKRIEFNNNIVHLENLTENNKPSLDILKEWINLVEKIEIASNLEGSINKETDRRLLLIAKDIINDKLDDDCVENPFTIIKEYIKSSFKEAFGIIESRSIGIFKNELKNIFNTNKLPKTFTVSEYGDEIVDLKNNHISLPYSIQDAIYIDTPMMLGIDVFGIKHWDDLNSKLKKSKSNNFSEYSTLISKDIIGGEAEFDDGFLSINEFVYKRSDGSIFNLLDCATGIKSFSILQLLLKNGNLNNKTLLVIDEPESNLHPQWIIEYARLIVLLNKNLGVKFFLASHNPDMVSAIKIIAEKENIISKVNFYLAKSSSKYGFNYEHLGQEIDPIFESFNIAFERMHFYGN